jgi:hypothetical protein
MPDSFRDLVQDTLLYLKDPLLPRQPVFVSQENWAFFQKKKGKESRLPPNQETIEAKHSVRVRPLLNSKVGEAAEAQESSVNFCSAKQVNQARTTRLNSLNLSRCSVDKPPDSTKQDHSPIKKTLQRIAPSLKLVDDILDDREAKRISSAWKEKIVDADVVLLVCDSHSETPEFLKTLAKAINQHLAKIKILMAERLEREKRWDLFLEKNSLQLIIASDAIQKLPELMRFYRSVPAQTQEGIAKLQFGAKSALFAQDSDSAQIAHSQSSLSMCAETEPAQKSSALTSKASFAIPSQFFLDKIPLLVLSPISMYKSVEHKALLWKTLCQMLK